MEKILRTVYKNKKLLRALRTVSHLTGAFAFVLFSFVSLKTVVASPLGALKLSLILGSSYIIVSLARRFINAPRPYEVYDFYDIPPKDKQGHSFPSRHSFLVFAIAAISAPVAPISAGILAFFGILLATSRVLSGIHFIKDVLTGALLGIICSLIGLLILSPY